MLLQEFVTRMGVLHNSKNNKSLSHNIAEPNEDVVVVVDELELSTAQLLVSPDAVQSFYECLCCINDKPTTGSCRLDTVVWHLEWSYWCSFDVFLPLVETIVKALQGPCHHHHHRHHHRGFGGGSTFVKRLILYDVEDAFPVHDDTLYHIMKDLARIPTIESLEMHGLAFGPMSAALDGLCDGIILAVTARPEQENKKYRLQRVVWSPFAANATQGATQIATTIIQCHFSGVLALESRMDPTAWEAVLRLLRDSRLGALHVRADNHSSTPPDPTALAMAMTTNTSLQSLSLHGTAMRWLCAATFPVDVPALLLRNQWLAKVRQSGSEVGSEPATFGRAVIRLVGHGPVALSALFILLRNHSYWIVPGIG